MKILVIVLANFILSITSISAFSEERAEKVPAPMSAGAFLTPMPWGSDTVVVPQGQTALVPGALSNFPPGTIHPYMERAIVEIREHQKKAMRIRFEFMSEPANIRLFAKFYRSLYDSLIKEGFSNKQALNIISGIDVLGSR